MNIILVLSQLQCGGAERVASQLYVLLRRHGYDVSFIILNQVDSQIFNHINKAHIYQLGTMPNGKLSGNKVRIKFIRQTVQHLSPDVIASFIDTTNILTILSCIGLKIPVIISERNNPKKSKMSKIWFLLRKLTYPLADALVVPNEGLKKACLPYHKRIRVIPNLLTLDVISSKEETKMRIIAVGSLSSQKRFDILIDAIGMLKRECQLENYSVSIYGEGPLRAKLQAQIDAQQLDSIITLHGQTAAIQDEYAKADIFVLSSDYEGQPNVLIEAMSSGLACIATDCPYGPNELIDNGQDGFLVPVGSSDQLAVALKQLIDNPLLISQFGCSARRKIDTIFNDNQIVTQWLQLFNSLCSKHEPHHSSF